MPLDNFTVDETIYADAKTLSPSIPENVDPPCTGCQLYERCQVMGSTFEAFGAYIRRGWWVDGDIGSKGLQFTHDHKLVYDFQDVSDFGEGEELGTHVFMKIARDSERVLDSIYQEFGIGPEDYRFSKTIVPVRLAQYDDDKLVSRSQAKRLLSGLEKFQNIILDFEGVPSIGQSFADEIFRVYKLAHPEKILLPDSMSKEVELMVNRVSTEGE